MNAKHNEIKTGSCRPVKKQSGRSSSRITLVEMVVVLSVLAILTAVLVPTVMSHIAQSRMLRARQDARAIGNAILQFYDTTGFMPQTRDSVDGRRGDEAVDMLVSAGEAPALPDAQADAVRWVEGSTDLLGNHLYHNAPGYRLKGPGEPVGWSGPYLSTLPEADPWGNRYMVNVVFLDPAEGLVLPNGEEKRAVFVISAGPSGVINTPFEQRVTAAEAEGDDITRRLQ